MENIWESISISQNSEQWEICFQSDWTMLDPFAHVSKIFLSRYLMLPIISLEFFLTLFLIFSDQPLETLLILNTSFNICAYLSNKSALSASALISFKSLSILMTIPYFQVQANPSFMVPLQFSYLFLLLSHFSSLFQTLSNYSKKKKSDIQNLLKSSTTAIGVYGKNQELLEFNNLFSILFPDLKLPERCYDLNIEGLESLEKDVENTVKCESGNWEFGEIEIAGTRYLCTGEIAEFNKENSLILRMLDIQYVSNLKKLSAESNMKSELLRTVSHELRSPLNSIMSMISSVSGFNQTSKNSEALKIASYTCSYLLYLINDLIDYSQIKAGCLRVSKSMFFIRPFIKDCIDLIQYQASIKSISIFMSIAENIPEKVFTDPFRLKQILLNLLTNALKFTTHGAIELIVEIQNEQLKFSCKDTGIGIDPKKLSILFTLFGKDDGNLQDLNPQGAGLGLYISNILVKKLGGEQIQVSSVLAIGSEFIFQIDYKDIHLQPRTQEEIPEEVNNIHLPSPTKTHNIAGLQNPLRNPSRRSFTILPDIIGVLIVDDCCFNSMVFTQILQKHGFYSHAVYNGAEAIQEILQNENRYQCILLDCEMPIMNGWETAEKLRNIEREKNIKSLPVILGTTSHNSSEIIKKCMNSGMDDTICKPCTGEELIERIRKLVRVRRLL